MTVIFSDDFNRADNASLGANWSDPNTGYNILGNELQCPGTSACSTTTNAHADIADCEVGARRASSTFDAGVFARGSFGGGSANTGSGYILNFFGTNSVDVIRRVNGSNTTLASRTQANSDGSQLSMRVEGTGATVTIKVFMVGVGQLGADITDTDASRITAAGRCGVFSFNSSSRVDDFYVDDLQVAVPPPAITDVDEDNTIVSTQTDVEIDGADFDTATVEIRQGSTTVAQSIDSQSSTAIQFDVVFESTTDLKYGDATLAVINDDDQEDTQAIEITAPSGHKYVDITTPDPTAANRITAVADIASGDQLEASNVQGGTIADLTLYADGTFDVAEGVTAFDVRCWDSGDSTWGSVATQSVGAGATGTRRNNLMLMGVG